MLIPWRVDECHGRLLFSILRFTAMHNSSTVVLVRRKSTAATDGCDVYDRGTDDSRVSRERGSRVDHDDIILWFSRVQKSMRRCVGVDGGGWAGIRCVHAHTRSSCAADHGIYANQCYQCLHTTTGHLQAPISYKSILSQLCVALRQRRSANAAAAAAL